MAKGQRIVRFAVRSARKRNDRFREAANAVIIVRVPEYGTQMSVDNRR